MENQEDNNKGISRIKNLRIFKTALNILSCTTSLVKSPIMTGISLIASIGSVITEAFIEHFESSNTESLEPAVVR